VKITLEPNPGKGYEFVDKITGGRIPREYINPTNQGIQRRSTRACSPATRRST
jgi:elongation factor G